MKVDYLLSLFKSIRPFWFFLTIYLLKKPGITVLPIWTQDLKAKQTPQIFKFPSFLDKMIGSRNNDIPGVKNTAHKMVSKYHSLLTEPKAR